jgi:hypothetical protein
MHDTPHIEKENIIVMDNIAYALEQSQGGN